MILLNSTDTLQVFLGGATTTTPGVLYAAFVDIAADGSTFAPGKASAPTNGATDVTLLASPASGKFRQVKYLSVYNADSVNMTVTVQITDSGTDRVLIVKELTPGQRLEYVDGNGFSTATAGGGGGGSPVWGDITGLLSDQGDLSAVLDGLSIACENVQMSDMTTDLTTGTAKAVWICGENGTLLDVMIGLNTVSSSGDVRIDMNDAGGTVFTTRPLIQVGEATNLTGTVAVLDSPITFVRGDKFIFDIDDAGTGAKCLQAVVRYLRG